MTPIFDNSYARLPERFFARRAPEIAPKPGRVKVNLSLGQSLGLDRDWLLSEAGLAAFSGATVPDGADPLAMAYAGHQFGNWVPQLGDGRAVLLGEVLDPKGKRYDLHLKGAGRTPFSRGGDGKAVLSAVLREYLISEAMFALGVPTTRALAAVTTGEMVYREEPEPGAVLCRVARGHIRVGTFQYFYARKDHEALNMLVEQVASRLDEPLRTDLPAPLALLDHVMRAQADLVAQWMSFGFIHGVMNTDNMSLTGETIDYGPCAFMEGFDPNQVFSSIDRQGRYAWGNQPRIAMWNLVQLAQCLLPLSPLPEDEATAAAETVLDGFSDCFEAAYQRRFAAKIGLVDTHPEAMVLVNELLTLMAEDRVDFTLFFQKLAEALTPGDPSVFLSQFDPESKAEEWFSKWSAEIAEAEALALMERANPVYIPRNHRVDAALKAANSGDFAPFETLLEVITDPYRRRADFTAFETPARADEAITQTFCGT